MLLSFFRKGGDFFVQTRLPQMLWSWHPQKLHRCYHRYHWQKWNLCLSAEIFFHHQLWSSTLPWLVNWKRLLVRLHGIHRQILFLIFWNMIFMSVLHIQSMSGRSKGKRRTKRIPNGLQTFLNLILSVILLFLQKISASSGKSPDTALSWSAWNLLKKTAFKTAWPFPISALPVCCLIHLERLRHRSCLISWNILLIPWTRRQCADSSRKRQK